MEDHDIADLQSIEAMQSLQSLASGTCDNGVQECIDNIFQDETAKGLLEDALAANQILTDDIKEYNYGWLIENLKEEEKTNLLSTINDYIIVENTIDDFTSIDENFSSVNIGGVVFQPDNALANLADFARNPLINEGNPKERELKIALSQINRIQEIIENSLNKTLSKLIDEKSEGGAIITENEAKVLEEAAKECGFEEILQVTNNKEFEEFEGVIYKGNLTEGFEVSGIMKEMGG